MNCKLFLQLLTVGGNAKLENSIIEIDQLTFIHNQHTKIAKWRDRDEMNKKIVKMSFTRRANERNKKCLTANKHLMHPTKNPFHSIQCDKFSNHNASQAYQTGSLFSLFLLFMQDLGAISNANNNTLIRFAGSRLNSES